MFLLRAIEPNDLKQVLSLAKLLAAVNLSGQPEELQKQIQKWKLLGISSVTTPRK